MTGRPCSIWNKGYPADDVGNAIPTRDGRAGRLALGDKTESGTSRRRSLLRQPGLHQGFTELGVVSTQAELWARNHARESLGFKFIASANAAFAR
jgi:hypothetical protein